MTKPRDRDKEKDILRDALAVPKSDREQFLREPCPDPTARADLEETLAETIGPDFPEARLAEPYEGPVHLPAGAQVGPYSVLGEIDRGGQGRIFLASDARLGRRIALKCLVAS